MTPTETAQAVRLANVVLDRPGGDPDDDLAVLARQFLRTQEALRALVDRIEGVFGWGTALNARGERLKDDAVYVAAYLAAKSGAEQ